MQKYLLLGIMTIIFVAFQNCAKQNLEEAVDTNIQTKQSEDLSAFPPADAQEISFTNSLDGVSFTTSSKTLPTRDMDVYKYALNVQEGIIRGLDIDEQPINGKVFCLTENESSELKTILETAKLCGAVEPTDPNIACSMIYKESYAEMSFADRSIALGEATSGCSRGADLCGEHSDLLKTFLKSLIINMSNRLCTQ